VAVSMGFTTFLQLLIFTAIMVLFGLSVTIKKYSGNKEMPYIPIIMAGWCFFLWLL
jgi:hypothetical protein